MRNRYRPAEIPKDTRRQDSVLLAVLVILILAFSLKLITFQVVISDSMKPVFARGDLVLSQGIFKEPNVGDIVTFKAANVQNPVTHRVINIQANSVTTRGDNNPSADDYGTTKNDVISKVIVIDGQPIVMKGVGSYFILDFTQQGALSKYGDKFNFLQQMFSVIRTWGYVITAIALIALIMSMAGGKR
ncbi:MAG: signal peptidase I [Candidatus Methanoperedens sp.]|nr:signal peptidase I [Candidatus Methanoperedens sp.]